MSATRACSRPPIRTLGLALLLALAAVSLAGCSITLWPPSTGKGTPAAGQAGSTPGVSAQGTPTFPRTPACKAEDLTALAGYQGATGAMSGAVSFTNKGSSPCALSGRPGIHVTDEEDNLLPVANLDDEGQMGTPTPGSGGPSHDATPLPAGIELKPGESAYSSFVWRNWCGDAQGPFGFAVALPGEGGQINVPALSPSGQPLTTAPRCDAPDSTSTISIGPFTRPPGR